MRHHYLGGEKFKSIQSAAVFLAEIPKNLKFIIKNRTLYGDVIEPINNGQVYKNKEKYLSKNNLNYKRLDFFQSIFPNCIFLITIRDPIYHANSLLKQHVHFSKLQKQNNFIRRYMNYLYHNEFGLDHKPWNKPIYYRDFSKIDYWIEQWFLFYNKILNEYKSYRNCYFIIYEELENPDYLKKLLKKINLKQIKNLNLNYFKNCNVSKINTNISSDNYKNAKCLYTKYKHKFTEE